MCYHVQYVCNQARIQGAELGMAVAACMHVINDLSDVPVGLSTWNCPSAMPCAGTDLLQVSLAWLAPKKTKRPDEGQPLLAADAQTKKMQ